MLSTTNGTTLRNGPTLTQAVSQIDTGSAITNHLSLCKPLESRADKKRLYIFFSSLPLVPTCKKVFSIYPECLSNIRYQCSCVLWQNCAHVTAAHTCDRSTRSLNARTCTPAQSHAKDVFLKKKMILEGLPSLLSHTFRNALDSSRRLKLHCQRTSMQSNQYTRTNPLLHIRCPLCSHTSPPFPPLAFFFLLSSEQAHIYSSSFI